jgi:hypothetical protein
MGVREAQVQVACSRAGALACAAAMYKWLPSDLLTTINADRCLSRTFTEARRQENNPIPNPPLSTVAPYCSGASDQNVNWVRWGTTTIEEACSAVRANIESFGRRVDRIVSGQYRVSDPNTVEIYCSNGYTNRLTDQGEQAFQNAVAITNKLPENVRYTCTFRVTD